MPSGTLVKVNNVTIGLSGNTGLSTGAHLHIGRYVSGKDTHPKGGGFTFNDAVVTEVGSDNINGNFVRIQADGASWVYLHLSKQLVTKGQVLKGGDVEPADYRMNEGDVINGFAIFKRTPSQLDIDVWVGQPFKKFQYEKLADGVAKMPPQGVKPYQGKELFVKE